MNVKIFLPVEDYTLTTKLKVEEVSKRLSEKIGAETTLKRFFWGNVTSRPYEGYFLINNFKIKRSIGYRNSFLPIISGLVYMIESKTYIKVEMKILSWVLVPTFLIIVLLTGASLVANGISDMFMFKRLFTFLFPTISYLLIYFAFKVESTRSKKFLAKLLEAEQIK